jgi:hypothetical protein
MAWINVYSEQEAEIIAKHFNKSTMSGSTLEARTHKKEIEPHRARSSTRPDNSSPTSQAPRQRFTNGRAVDPENLELRQQPKIEELKTKSFTVFKARYFKDLIKQEVDEIKGSFEPQVFIEETESKADTVTYQISSKSEIKLSECFFKMESLIKTRSKKVSFTASEFEQVLRIKNELIKLLPNQLRNYVYVQFDLKKNCYIVYYYEKLDENHFTSFIENIKKYSDERIESGREFTLADSDQFDCLQQVLGNRNDLKCEFDREKLKLVIMGKKIQIDNFNVNDMIRLVEKDIKIINKYLIPHLNHRLKCYKNELQSDGLILKFDQIEKSADSLSFKILSAKDKEAEANAKANEIAIYCNEVKLLVIDFEDQNSGKRLEKELNSLNLDNCHCHYDRVQRKFFINSINSELLNILRIQIELKKGEN